MVAPVRVSEQRLQQFVVSKQQWIVQALNKMAATTEQAQDFAPDVFKHGAEISYQGQRYQIAIQPSKLKTIKIELTEQLLAHVPQSLMAVDHAALLKKAVIRWLKKQALVKVQQLVELHGANKQLWPRTVSIKTQKSRWGSCGIHNDIHINWLLIMAPPDVLEYVVVHELCHIRVRNHSQHFWALVLEHLPAFKNSRQWLKKNGGTLMQVAQR